MKNRCDATITTRKRKGELQRDLGCPDEFAVFSELTVNRDFAAGSNCIQEGLAISPQETEFTMGGEARGA